MIEDLPSLHLPPDRYLEEGFIKAGHASCDQRLINAGRIWLGRDLARIKEYLRSRPYAVLTLNTMLHETSVSAVKNNPGAFFESAFERQFHRRFNERRSAAKCRYDNRSGCEIYMRRDFRELEIVAREVAAERDFQIRNISHLLDVPDAYLLIMRNGDRHFLPDSLGEHLAGNTAISPEILGDFLCHCERLGVPELNSLLKDTHLRDCYNARCKSM